MKVRWFQAAEARRLFTLALPVFLAQIAQTSMGFVDTVVAGKASPTDMASVAVASSFWMPTMLFGQGMLMAITPLVAQTLGADSRGAVGRFLRQGAWLALFIAALLMAVIYGISLGVLHMDRVEPDLARLTSGYLQAIMWGLPGLMLYCAQRAFLEGHGRTRPAMLAGFIGLGVNIPLNFVFVFGWLGAPALGGVGCGVASAVVCWVMSFVMFLSVRRFKPRAWRFEALQLSLALRIARIGLPGAFAMLVETLSFAIIAVLIAPLGTAVVAGHQVAMNVMNLSFSFGDGMQVASVALCGRSLGEKRPDLAVMYGTICQRIGNMISIVLSILYLTLGNWYFHLYFVEEDIIAMGARIMQVMTVIVLLQISQVIYMGCLRGAGDVVFTTCASTLSITIVRPSCAYLFCYVLEIGVVGIWLGIVCDQIVRVCLTNWRFKSGKWTKIKI